MKNQLAKAICLAATAFINKHDKGGSPYIMHCIRVMNGVDQNDEELMCIAVLHDLIEDCGDKYTFEILANDYGFSDRVVRTIAILTHDKTISSYEDYIKDISRNKDARAVKMSDLKDNSDITRLKGLRKKDFDRMERYQKAFIYLHD